MAPPPRFGTHLASLTSRVCLRALCAWPYFDTLLGVVAGTLSLGACASVLPRRSQRFDMAVAEAESEASKRLWAAEDERRRDLVSRCHASTRNLEGFVSGGPQNEHGAAGKGRGWAGAVK